MSGYDHLAHLYRLCTNHNSRGIHKIGGEITEPVKKAMYSLSTPYPLPNLQATISFIRSGGTKANGVFITDYQYRIFTNIWFSHSMDGG